jgi:hypothetical protein
MMSFTITIDTTEGDIDSDSRIAVFAFNGEREACALSVETWCLRDYISHWLSSLEHLRLTHIPVALFTCVRNPGSGVPHIAWVFYPHSQARYAIQQHLRFGLDVVEPRGGIVSCTNKSRRLVCDEGEAISEWEVSDADVIGAEEQLRELLRTII